MRRMRKMIGGGIQSCPPGFYCMDTGTILIGLLVCITLIAGVVYIVKQNSTNSIHHTKPTIVVLKTTAAAAAAPPQMIQTDPRFAPLSPEQTYSPPPDIHGFPTPPLSAGIGRAINIQTRGYPDSYQQIGVLTAPGGTANSATPTRTILPLFGRKLATNRDRWNYYTRTDGMNPVQVPLQYNRRNCDDDTGCSEIMDGETVGVPIMGQSFVANVYRYSTPRYLPIV